MSASHRRGFTRIELLVVVGLGLILLALATPAIQRARVQSRREACANHLKQVGLAMHNYHDVHRTFPPGWVAHHRHPGRQLHLGWQTMLLPYVEQSNLYNGIDFDDPEKTDEKLLQTSIPTYVCPADSTPPANPLRDELGTSNYTGNFGPLPPPRWAMGSIGEFWPGRAETPEQTAGILWCNSSARIRDVTDGTSNTMMAAERGVTSLAGLWPGVRGNDFETDAVTGTSHGSRPNHGEFGLSSRHIGGVNIGFCDGAVRFVADEIDSQPKGWGTFQKLGARNDGMVLGNF